MQQIVVHLVEHDVITLIFTVFIFSNSHHKYGFSYMEKVNPQITEYNVEHHLRPVSECFIECLGGETKQYLPT